MRPYDPALGRFLQTDLVEGGTPNDYVYPADPVNQFDLDGRAQNRNPCLGGRYARGHKKQCKGFRGGFVNLGFSPKAVVANNWRTWTYFAAAGTCIVASFGTCAGVVAVGLTARTAMTFSTHGFNRSSLKTVGIDGMFSWSSVALVGAPAALGGMPRLANAALATGEVVCALRCPTHYR